MNQSPAHPMHGQLIVMLDADVRYNLPAGAAHYASPGLHGDWRDAAKAAGAALEYREIFGLGSWVAKNADGDVVGRWTCHHIAGHGYLMQEA